ncbi:MAG: hypothetical protein H0X26_00220 [Alphaproteobacteria bacterium]|nr:hypothetical protein [Alphaproteobacteria bacterium]
MSRKFKIVPALTGACALLLMSVVFVQESKGVDCKYVIDTCEALGKLGRGCEGFAAISGAVERCRQNHPPFAGGDPKNKDQCESEVMLLRSQNYKCDGDF